MIRFLKGHQLFDYVDGSLPCPPSTIDGTPNLDHSKRLLQDQLIISTLNASLSDSMFAQVLSCTTSHEVWSTLKSLFAAQLSAHIMQTKYQLATLKKGSSTISKYFNKATLLVATLGAVGHPFSSSKFIIYLLAGLGSNCESL